MPVVSTYQNDSDTTTIRLLRRGSHFHETQRVQAPLRVEVTAYPQLSCAGEPSLLQEAALVERHDGSAAGRNDDEEALDN